MKIINTKILLYVLLFLTAPWIASNAQSKTRLKVGEQAPSLSAYRWISGDSVSSFSEESFYLIEFGATWCKPCIVAIPELSSIQREFDQQLKVISVFVMERNPYDEKYILNIQSFVKKHGDKINYSVAADWPDGRMQNDWLSAAQLEGIPHLFIVDSQGSIRWIGGAPSEARKVIVSLIENNTVPKGIDKAIYDPNKLLLIDNNGGTQTDFIFRSLLTRYDGSISGLSLDHIFSFHDFKPDSIYDQYEDKLELIGYPIAKLYYMAYADTLSNIVPVRQNRQFPDTLKLPYTRSTYGKYWYEPIVQVSNRAPFEFSWNRSRNRYNYSLKVPAGMGTAAFLQAALRRDLETYFGYSVTIETRAMPYWRLSVQDKKRVQSMLLSKNQGGPLNISDASSPFVFKNAEVRDVIAVLGIYYGYGSLDYGRLPKNEQAPFVDETGISKSIDFQFKPEWTFKECQDYLNSLGLQLTRGLRNMKVVLISDPPE